MPATSPVRSAGRLRYIQPGMELSATADTRHRTWRLTDVRRFRIDGGNPAAPSGVASVEFPSNCKVKESTRRGYSQRTMGDADTESPRPPRRSLWRRAIPYVFSCMLIGVGLFFGSVAQRMVTHQETFTDAVVRQIVHVPTPQEVFHRERIYVMLLGIDYDYDDRISRSPPTRAATRSWPPDRLPVEEHAPGLVLRDSDVNDPGPRTKINGAYSLGA